MKRRSIWELIVLALMVAVTLGILAGAYFVLAGVSARPEPSGLETLIARTVRNLAIGWHAGTPGTRRTPVQAPWSDGERKNTYPGKTHWCRRSRTLPGRVRRPWANSGA